MSGDFDIQNTSQGADTQPSCELGDDSKNTESYKHHPTLSDSEEADKVVPPHITSNTREHDEDKQDGAEGENKPVKALESDDGQGAPVAEATNDRPVAGQSPNLEALDQPKKVMPDEVKRIALDLHTKGKSPKQIAAHYSVSDYRLTEGDILDLIREQKGMDEVSAVPKSFNSQRQYF